MITAVLDLPQLEAPSQHLRPVAALGSLLRLLVSGSTCHDQQLVL